MHADFLLFPPIFDGHVDASTEQVVLHVVELRNIQAAKRILARRRRQKLKLALLLQSTGPGGAQQHSSHTEGRGVAGLDPAGMGLVGSK